MRKSGMEAGVIIRVRGAEQQCGMSTREIDRLPEDMRVWWVGPDSS